MKIFIICAKRFYNEIPRIQEKLKELGHSVTLPVLYEIPQAEEQAKAQGEEIYAEFKRNTYNKSSRLIAEADAVLCLNFEKKGVANYIGSGTFLEIFQAFMGGKKIYLWNYVPEGLLFDELNGFMPISLKRNLKRMI